MMKHYIKEIISLLRQIDSPTVLNYIHIVILDIAKEYRGGVGHE